MRVYYLSSLQEWRANEPSFRPLQERRASSAILTPFEVGKRQHGCGMVQPRQQSLPWSLAPKLNFQEVSKLWRCDQHTNRRFSTQQQTTEHYLHSAKYDHVENLIFFSFNLRQHTISVSRYNQTFPVWKNRRHSDSIYQSPLSHISSFTISSWRTQMQQ